VTGHNGYIGCLLIPLLLDAGHDPVGLDSYLFSDCTFGEDTPDVESLRIDVRDVTPDQLEGFDAVVHLAALSNDPLGDLDPEVTYDINWRAAVRLAEMSREAGVERFAFSSSCSLYGASGDDLIDEDAAQHPVTPYGRSKALAEQQIMRLGDDGFHPISLRNATAYGFSPRLRGDLVVNNLVAIALATGEALVKSDGSPWRPLVHAQDIARGFVRLLESPAAEHSGGVFNFGRTSENYRVSEVADMVAEVVPGARVVYAPGGTPDERNYRVDCERFATAFPDFEFRWSVRDGVEEVYRALAKAGFDSDSLSDTRFLRILRVKELQGDGLIGRDLRPAADVAADPG
jgi:nucleoside-diphosphate-sugar epimerase